jgi:DNA-directed RNA polymerase specialized sigma24 family protein
VTYDKLGPLPRVQAAAAAKARVDQEYRNAVVAAAHAGYGYGDIARAAGRSRQAMRVLVNRNK